MIAYNKDWLDALIVRENADRWYKKGLISEEKWKHFKTHFEAHFYSPNLFVRIGLALFCFILLMAAIGIFALMGFVDSETGSAVLMLVFGAFLFLILESRIIQGSYHLRSGIDDMVLYVGVCCILGGIFILLPSGMDTQLYWLISWPFLLFASLRYLDRLMTLGLFICSLGILFQIVDSVPQGAFFLLPISSMIFCAGVYFWAKKVQNRYSLRHWNGQIVLLELLSLLTFYASGNVYVLQELGVAVFKQQLTGGISLFFWVFTFLVPIGFIVEGLRVKDRMMLNIGLFCVALSVFTYRVYYHVLPLAWAATFVGLVLFVGAYFSIRYLRKHSGGYTYDQDGDPTMLQEIEEQLIEQTIVNQPLDTPTKKDGFGGGGFGGSGASGDF
jgi:hypothetical protein